MLHIVRLTGYLCCVQWRWVDASKKQCEELLEFICHLAKDDEDGDMAVKVSCIYNFEGCRNDTA